MKPLLDETHQHLKFILSDTELTKFRTLVEKFNNDKSEGEHDPKDAVHTIQIEYLSPTENFVAFQVKEHLYKDWDEMFYKEMK